MDEIEEVERMVLNSGNSFHCKVLNYLKLKGWTVLISPYYNDNISDKPREIDLIAEKAFRVNDHFGQNKGIIIVRLFIECKYVPQKIAFWFHDKDRSQAEELVVNNFRPLHKNNTYTQQHHYLSDNNRVAKLFASESKKSEENEIIYKAINQSLNALIYFRGEDSIMPSTVQGGMNLRERVCYPIIICNSFSAFYRVEVDSEKKPSPINDHFQLEVNYAYIDTNEKHRNEYFLIDVLDFKKMDGFLDSLQADVSAMSELL